MICPRITKGRIVRYLITTGIRAIVALARLALVLTVLWQGARLALRPDPRDALRRADALYVVGRYHDALAIYRAIVAREPQFVQAFVRLGMVTVVRGEYAEADRALAHALELGLTGNDHDLMRLYQGRAAAATGSRDEAAQLWATISERSPLYPLRRTLEAESLLAAGDYAGAEASYRAARQAGLPSRWRAVADLRLAALRASSDPPAALVELAGVEGPRRWLPADIDALTAPLIPTPALDPRALDAALRAAPDQRAQMLGQIYLQAGLYTLAEAQFAAVAPDSPAALGAAAYAAYTRWRAGDYAGGLQRLESLVAARPDEPRARSLLALAYLTNQNTQAAQSQLEVVRALAPRAPDTHLAWGQWYAVRHDYLAAAEEFQRALDEAPPEQRGLYALALARFHLDISLLVCETGRPAAEEAVLRLPDAPGAWSALASARLICGDAAGARVAAELALRHDPASAEASYYLGRALAALGDRIGARRALVNAADLAPASTWRDRAEAQLVVLGL